jgi:hypothetical protein
LPRFEANGVKLYAVSYDDQDALAAYAKARGIGFPLLSDPDSSVIRQYGILNTLIDERDAPFYGIPNPGTFVVDEAGVIVEKFFPRHIALRESADSVLDSALGELLMGDAASESAGDEDVRVEVFLHGGGGDLKSGPMRRVIVRFTLREGLHIYGEPVPDGMVSTQVRVAGPEGLHFEEVILPPTELLTLPGLDDPLHVWSGQVDLAIPLYANSDLFSASEEGTPSEIELDVSVRYQACDDRTCLIPRTERFTLRVPLAGMEVPSLMGMGVVGQNRAVEMDSAKYFAQLNARQTAGRDG